MNESKETTPFLLANFGDAGWLLISKNRENSQINIQNKKHNKNIGNNQVIHKQTLNKTLGEAGAGVIWTGYRWASRLAGKYHT